MIIGIDASRANQAQKTGVEWYAWHIIEELKKIIPDNIRVVLYSREKLTGDLARLPAAWDNRVLFWPPGKLWTQLRLSFEMWRRPPDVLFVPAHAAPLVHPRKTVVTIHDVAANLWPQSYHWFERWYTVWSAKYAVKKLWRVIAPSEFVKNSLKHLRYRRKYFGAMVNIENKIKVIAHGYNENYRQIYQPEEIKTVLEKYNITRPFLLSIGRLEEKKNTKRIIRAFNQICSKSRSRGYQLVLVGRPGFGYSEVKKEINNSPYKDKILELGWVAQPEAAVIMRAAAVFVFPGLYEGFGLPVLEAMVAGTPVVAAAGSGLEEVGGDACLYVNPENVSDLAGAIGKLLANAKLSQNLILAGRERGKMFSWRRAATETFDLLGQD